MTRVRMAVIGVGHLGKIHARILAGMPEVELVGVVDAFEQQACTVAETYGTRAYTSHVPLLDEVHAAVIAVPTVHHYAVAADFLQRGIALLIEKPLAANLTEARFLVELAEKHGAILQVGHVERFNPAFEELCRRPMQPKLIDCERVGPFTGRSTDIGAVLDMMIHDIDLVLALVRSQPVKVEALGACVYGGHEDMASARVTFSSGCVANLTASRVSPKPARKMRVWGPEGFASIDFGTRLLTLAQPSAQFRLAGMDLRKLGPAARLKDDLFGKHLEFREIDCNRGDALTAELRDLVHCVRTGARPRVSGADACAAIALATQILDSMRAHHWNGCEGPTGPHELPPPIGPLFVDEHRAAA